MFKVAKIMSIIARSTRNARKERKNNYTNDDKSRGENVEIVRFTTRISHIAESF